MENSLCELKSQCNYNVPNDDITPEKCRERRQRRMESRRRRKCAEPVTERVVVTPVYGTVSIAGRMRVMEDAVVVSTLCKEKLHNLVKDELMRVTPPCATEKPVSDEEDVLWKQALKRAFIKMDDLALSTCACGFVSSSSSAAAHGCDCSSSTVGSTATVAVVTPDEIIVANCGDSRAVLCRRRGRDFPLSADHKPDRPDELARIEAAGGRVMYLDGARVQGVLAMSRAIDLCRQAHILSHPQYSAGHVALSSQQTAYVSFLNIDCCYSLGLPKYEVLMIEGVQFCQSLPWQYMNLCQTTGSLDTT
ncbi:hypothetical protein KSS87_013009 [Heliosperma pusillum]|nr:hypothetical protein KSS87_013009 [Heliosperma pusillum]